jgi:membrane-bound lytic murein transglycosylase D
MVRSRVFTLVVSFFAVASSAFAANPDFSREGLEQRVDFWKKIYTQYGENDVVIHDGLRVNLIYDVATDDDVKAKLAAVKDLLREIGAGLEMPENFSPEAQQVANAITAQGIPLTAANIDDLIDNLHTQRGVKEQFRDGIVRSGAYTDAFREILAKAGVPEELALLPLVESSFENARSRAGAVGMWQFTRSTGRLYLKINNKVDERLDPHKAAQAAARLLRDNYDALGSWPLAITAYNHGQGGMLRAQKAHGSDLIAIINDYKGPVFGFASMNFYSEFLAALEVYNDYPAYFGELVLNKPASPVQAVAAKPSPAPKPRTVVAAEKYKVQRGDTLWEVAQRFGTTIRSLMELNNLNESAIYAGQILLVK